VNLPPLKVCLRIHHLFRLLGAPNANEAKSADKKLRKLLSTHGLTWNDLPAVIVEAERLIAEEDAKKRRAEAAARYAGPQTGAKASATDAPQINILDLVLRLIELHIGLTPEQRMAVALWALHTYVFGRFPITPRLALLSPVRGCGKTLLLILLELLTADPYRSDNVSAAVLYHELAHRERTLLLDEGDNLGLLNNPVLRAIFNAGHRRGGVISRFVGGRSQRFPVHAPLAVAAIGTLPLPIMHRAITIYMRRHAPSDAVLQPLEEFSPVFPAARTEISKWAATCSFDLNPEMPSQLRNRAADNWRVLFSIADNLGHGEAARAAAVALNADRMDEDPGVVLLTDIRTVFEAADIDHISSAALVEALIALDSLWDDWRGPHDDRPPRKLTQSELARLLRPFGIRPHTIWPAQRRAGAKSSKGYSRSQFEAAWAAYCSPAGTPAQPRKIIHLLGE
jgi:Protein of unknown function (DUF3631)